MGMPYYVHEDDADEFDKAPNIRNEKLRIVIRGVPEDPWNYYIYCSRRGRLPGRHEKPRCEHDFTDSYTYCTKCDKIINKEII